MLTHISVRGAREHNLKDVSVEIPRDTLTVITVAVAARASASCRRMGILLTRTGTSSLLDHTGRAAWSDTTTRDVTYGTNVTSDSTRAECRS